ncbi:hypothetical protein QTI66_19605 [Variovorax sp. J22R133]|uniref:hypothetical protein n=1 Tax=Variovorax brevis TaxID=3053503 RepID=UPI00257766CF|nr:hypothetical protein [Variovorax sp. J22R133]MDM0114369.1 hypothetical protein [Variovorax sp. J22R133]
MTLRSLAVLAAAHVAVCACVGTGGPARQDVVAGSVVIPLRATPVNAGNVGRITLLPMGGETSVRVDLSGVPAGTTAPIHVYTFIYEAACDALPSKAAYALNDRVLVSNNAGNLGVTPRGPYRLAHTAPLSMNELLSGRFSIALRSAPADGDRVIYCGELRRA